MLPKVLRYEDPFFENTHEPRVRLLEPVRNKAGFYKHACAEVNDYLATIQPQPGKRYVLVLAMSASEYYGPNRNGDGFSEEPVKVGDSYAVAPGETLVDHFQTFETHANVFRHHINKDPNKGFGKVVKAFYNFDMHRVELLLEVDVRDGNDIVCKIDNGEFPGVSMGCRIKYDVCNLCGNKAPTREQYCEHVNGMNPEFGMNQLLPDGRRCFVWNPSPVLFDISFVFKPADKIGYTMKKVAYSDPYELKLSADLGAEVERLNSKRAALQKVSDIDKVIHGEVVNPESVGLGPGEVRLTQSLVKNVVPGIVSQMPELPEEILQALSGLSIPGAMSSMSACGMCPSASELYYIISAKQGVEPDRAVANKIAATQGALADVLADIPQALDTLEKRGLLKLSQDLVNVHTVNKLQPYMEKRSMWEDYLARKHVPESWGVAAGEMTGAFNPESAYYSPAWKPLHYQDPKSGRTYQTTQNAAERADWDNQKKKAIEGVGLAGLLGVGVKSIGANNKFRWLAAPSLLAAGGIGHKMMQGQKVPKVTTVEGERVPANTEFVEKRSSAMKEIGAPIAGGALATFLLAQDYLGSNGQERQGVSGSLGRAAHEHPYLSTIAGTGILSGGAHLLGGLRGRFKRAMADITKTASYDPQKPPNVPFEDLVYKIGQFIVDSDGIG